MCQMPRITCRRPREVEGGPAVRKFMRGELAHEDRAGLIELASRSRVRVGDAIEAHFRMPRGADPLGVVDVFQGEGHTVHWSAVRAGHDLVLGMLRLLTCEVERRGDTGVQQ